jgi:hypothetical protein
MLQNRWARDIVGAPTTQVLCQYLHVWELLRGVVLDPMQAGRFIWKWTADGKYSAQSTYRAFFAGSTSLLGAREVWKTKSTASRQVLLLAHTPPLFVDHERCKRHGLLDDDACVLRYLWTTNDARGMVYWMTMPASSVAKHQK